MLDVTEFTALLRRISPKASSISEAQQLRHAIAKDRLQQRIAHVAKHTSDPAKADAMMQIVVLGPSQAGKTYLLNQVLHDKLPKGATVSVGAGGVVLSIGEQTVAVQVIDVPGDARYAPLGTLFFQQTPYVCFVYDATSYESFTALDALFDSFQRANPVRLAAPRARQRPCLPTTLPATAA